MKDEPIVKDDTKDPSAEDGDGPRGMRRDGASESATARISIVPCSRM